MKLRSSDIEQTMPATLSQFAAFGIVLKSMHFINLPCHAYQSSYHAPSEYTQSVIGHGRQQSTVPSAEGTGAQNRPSRSGTQVSEAIEEHSRFSESDLHPTVLGKFDSCKKGAVQSPRAVVMLAIGSRALAIFASKVLAV